MEEKINLDDLSSKDPGVKFGCAKKLLSIARNNPSSLYLDIDFFIKILDSGNHILKWTAIDIIGNLSRVDKDNKVDKLIRKMYGYLNSGELITVNHAISALSDIALAKPEYQDDIISELLKVEHYSYPTDECRNIAIGKVILAFGNYSDKLVNNKEVIAFVSRQTKNRRSATAKKAEQLLKKLNRTSENKH